eukprot:Nitzschia sp. Nitz4//scaffold100_size80364//69150//70262//NITZ4_005350-RA/size80364-processed-gene-0.40-mRNA-1//1//CDS//3329532112//4506//frame0
MREGLHKDLGVPAAKKSGSSSSSGDTPLEPHNTECPICLMSPLDPETTTVLEDCKHGFCTSCLISWQRTAKKWHSMHGKTPFVCPYCRTQTTAEGQGDVEANLISQLYLLAARANSRYCSTPEASVEMRNDALAQLEPLFDSTSQVTLKAFMLKAQLLTAQGRGSEAVQVLVDMVQEDQRRKDLPVMDLLHRATQARERGDWFEFERLELQLSNAYEEMGGSMPDRLSPSSYQFDIPLLKCDALEAGKEWKLAIDCYKELLGSTEEMPPPIATRQIFLGMARCFYELGVYDRSIAASEAAIMTNRHFPDIHKYKALSEKAQGKLDAAIRTMGQAVLYETPWDDDHMKEVQTLYYELLAERDAQQASSEAS